MASISSSMGSGRIEKLSLQLRGQRVPLHDRRRAETSQNFLLVADQDCFTGTIPSRGVVIAMSHCRHPSLEFWR